MFDPRTEFSLERGEIHRIGEIRRRCRNNERPENVVRVVARGLVASRVISAYGGLAYTPSRRLGRAGAHVTDRVMDGVPPIEPGVAAELMVRRYLYCEPVGPEEQGLIDALLDLFDVWALQNPLPNVPLPSGVTATAAMARNIANERADAKDRARAAKKTNADVVARRAVELQADVELPAEEAQVVAEPVDAEAATRTLTVLAARAGGRKPSNPMNPTVRTGWGPPVLAAAELIDAVQHAAIDAAPRTGTRADWGSVSPAVLSAIDDAMLRGKSCRDCQTVSWRAGLPESGPDAFTFSQFRCYWNTRKKKLSERAWTREEANVLCAPWREADELSQVAGRVRCRLPGRVRDLWEQLKSCSQFDGELARFLETLPVSGIVPLFD
jgi:hypothetical protein